MSSAPKRKGESMSSAPKRKGGREQKKRCLEEGASKYAKISDLFGKPPTVDSDKKVSG